MFLKTLVFIQKKAYETRWVNHKMKAMINNKFGAFVGHLENVISEKLRLCYPPGQVTKASVLLSSFLSDILQAYVRPM